MAAIRRAEATWSGALTSGSGEVSAISSSAFSALPVTWASRTETSDGRTSPEELVAAAQARGFTALACTDTNGVYGAVEFQKAAESAGIRPILGAHLVYGDEECVALAEDERG
jgi:hypothetical protein